MAFGSALSLGVASVAIGLGGAAAAIALRRAWLRAARLDPNRDPAARWVDPGRVRALDALLAAPPVPLDAVDRGLALCAVDELLSWRGGLRRLQALVEALPDTADGRALRAEVALRLGEVPSARVQTEALPADHWRGCAVRAELYEIDGDVGRAESAWVAAASLAPEPRRAELYARLARLRARHNRVAVGHALLWERPPR